MNKIHKLKEAVAAQLRQGEGLEDVGILTAFPGEKRDFPLARPVVAVGLEGAEVSPGGLGGYWGEGDQGPVTGPRALLTLRLDLYAPQEEGGDRLHLLWEALCAALMTGGRPLGVQKLWCGETGFDAQARAWRLTAKAVVEAVLAEGEGGVPMKEIQLLHEEGKDWIC